MSHTHIHTVKVNTCMQAPKHAHMHTHTHLQGLARKVPLLGETTYINISNKQHLEKKRTQEEEQARKNEDEEHKKS